MWTEVSSSEPYFLQVGLLLSTIICKCLLKVCPVSRPITTLECVLLKDNNRALVARSGPEINSQACLCWLQHWLNQFFFYVIQTFEQWFKQESVILLVWILVTSHKSVSSLVDQQTYNRTAAHQSSDIHLHAYHRVCNATHFRSLHHSAETISLFSQHTTPWLSDGSLIASWQHSCLMSS